MDRQYILAELHYTYETDCFGTITSVGKYQGQPLYVPYFWQYIIANDMFDRVDTTHGYLAYVIKISKEDTSLFPQLGNFTELRFWLGATGFVYHSAQGYIPAHNRRERSWGRDA
jgi:hypothetical protein